MADMKKLYLNGRLVGEYQTTGDDEKDKAACIALLREKGLYHETIPEEAIFRQAVSFATTASYLYNRDLITVPRNGMSVAPFVVNATFALELYLKALGYLYGKPPRRRSHNLLELFDALPSEAHKSLQQNFAKSTWQCGINELLEFRKVLAEMRNAFIEWRYLHEARRVSEIRIAPMIFTMEVLHETCRAHHKLRSDERRSEPTP